MAANLCHTVDADGDALCGADVSAEPWCVGTCPPHALPGLRRRGVRPGPGRRAGVVVNLIDRLRTVVALPRALRDIDGAWDGPASVEAVSGSNGRGEAAEVPVTVPGTAGPSHARLVAPARRSPQSLTHERRSPMALHVRQSIHVFDSDGIKAVAVTDDDTGRRTAWIVFGELGEAVVSLHLSDEAADALQAALIDLARMRDTLALAAEAAS